MILSWSCSQRTYHCSISIAQKAVSFIALLANTTPDAGGSKLTGCLIQRRWEKWSAFPSKALDLRCTCEYLGSVYSEIQGLKITGSNPQALSPSCRFGVALMESQLDSFYPCQDLVRRNQRTWLMWISDKQRGFCIRMSHIRFGGMLVLEKNLLCIWNSNLTMWPALYPATLCSFFHSLEWSGSSNNLSCLEYQGLVSLKLRLLEFLQLCEVLLWLLGNRYCRDISHFFFFENHPPPHIY